MISLREHQPKAVTNTKASYLGASCPGLRRVSRVSIRSKMAHFSVHSETGSSIFRSVLESEKQTKRTSDLPIVFSRA